jgi:hypothetical protein
MRGRFSLPSRNGAAILADPAPFCLVRWQFRWQFSVPRHARAIIASDPEAEPGTLREPLAHALNRHGRHQDFDDGRKRQI